MQNMDYFFFYKYISRHILMSKLGYITNTHKLPQISRLLFSFSSNRLDDLDDVQGYNYLYMFKFFFGKRAYLTKLRSHFSLGLWTYSFSVCLSIKYEDIFKVLLFILNDIIPSTDKGYLSSGVYSIKYNIFYSILKDSNVFSEKKTNLGLFSLKKNLNFKLFCTGTDLVSTKIMFRNIKIYNF